MNTDKIREVIADLQEDIRFKAEALSSLQKLLFSLSEKEPAPIAIATSDNLVLTDSVKTIMFGTDESYVDLAVKLIQVNKRPLSVSEIVEHIRLLKNNPQIERRSVEATLHQHVAKSQNPRLIKMSPGTYGLAVRDQNTAA